ncbi:hypothetical protein BgiMline_016441, partial [Biomphalaria glabrata]
MQTCGFGSVYLSTAKSRQQQIITKFVCQQCHLTQDAILEVFLGMVNQRCSLSCDLKRELIRVSLSIVSHTKE